MSISSDIIINPELSPADTDGLSALAGTLLRGEIPTGAELVYDGRNRLYVHTLPSGRKVNIKAFRRGGALKKLIYGRLRFDKGRHSYDNARRLLALGFDTPQPLMTCSARSAGRWFLERAFYVCAQEDAVRQTRCWEEWPDRDALVEALGQEMGRLFRAGVLFRDFSPGNVLLRTGTPAGEYRFVYVDVNRTDFGVRSRRRLMSMFRRINIVEAETSRLARALARDMGWDPEATRLRALVVLRRFLWLKDDVQKPLKRLIRPGNPKYRRSATK